MAPTSRYSQGSHFPRRDRSGSVGDRALTPQSINLILKRRCAAAGSTRLTSRRKACSRRRRFWRRSLADASSRAKSGLRSLPRRSDGLDIGHAAPIRRHSLTKLTSTKAAATDVLLDRGRRKGACPHRAGLVILRMVRGGDSASNKAGYSSTGSEMSCPRTTELRGCDWRERRARHRLRRSASNNPTGGGRREDGTSAVELSADNSTEATAVRRHVGYPRAGGRRIPLSAQEVAEEAALGERHWSFTRTTQPNRGRDPVSSTGSRWAVTACRVPRFLKPQSFHAASAEKKSVPGQGRGGGFRLSACSRRYSRPPAALRSH